MKLLKEVTELSFTEEQIKESINKHNGRLVISGVIQRADALNQNGRIYPKHILEKEINNYIKLVNERRATGELDHTDEAVVNLKNVSHVITKIWMENNGDVFGDIEVLDNLPMGKILYGLLERGVKVGISSRALGSVEHSHEGDIVQDDLHLVCFDMVSDPSTHNAWMSLKEGKEYSPEDLKKIFSRSDRIDRAANEILRYSNNNKK